ncbi:MAG: Metallo-beta-lactamase family protein [Bacteroidetes bacterium]|nr:MAG: Metallo-beta-lactamase family protein [Bacteroidota bacterium]
MYIEQLYTNCLAEAAYYIESEGEAAIIDPIRETEPYMHKASVRGAKIKYVFETHFHADFVSGHIDLAKASGAQIIYGPQAETGYKVYNAKDGEEFIIGKIRLRVLHTPGHTPESSCYLLIDENEREHAIFTGDTLFVGDVGRPDLLDGMMTKEELASMLYDSLNSKIKTLADDVLVYPAHGPGSSCGKNIGKETWSTIGQQKRTNYALQEMSREKFVQVVTEGLSAPPQYFFKDAMINKNGYESIEEVLSRNVNALDAAFVQKAIAAGALVLDVRAADDFEKGFIPGAVNIGLDGTFAVWVGTLLPIDRQLLVLAPAGREQEAILRLARIGFENVAGYLAGGIESWKAAGQPVKTIRSVTPEEFAADVIAGNTERKIMDVRRVGEFENGHVQNAFNSCLTGFTQSAPAALDKNEPYYIHCQAGYRSMIASSILSAAGFENIVNVKNGWSKIKDTGIPLEMPVKA